MDSRFEGGGDSSVYGRIQVTDVVDGFNQIGFALTVFSKDPVCFWRKFRLQVGILESALNPGIGLPFSA